MVKLTPGNAESKKSELLPFRDPGACQPPPPRSLPPASLASMAEKGREVVDEGGLHPPESGEEGLKQPESLGKAHLVLSSPGCGDARGR